MWRSRLSFACIAPSNRPRFRSASSKDAVHGCGGAAASGAPAPRQQQQRGGLPMQGECWEQLCEGRRGQGSPAASPSNPATGCSALPAAIMAGT